MAEVDGPDPLIDRYRKPGWVEIARLCRGLERDCASWLADEWCATNDPEHTTNESEETND